MSENFAIVFRVRKTGDTEFVTEYLVREEPELWRDKEDLGPWKPVPYPTIDKGWEKARSLATPGQRVHAIERTTGQKADLRQSPAHEPTPRRQHHHRAYDPDWRSHVPNAGIE